MSELLLVKRHGTLQPMTDADAEIIHGMKSGEVYRMKWTKPRNYKFLQKYFVLVNDVLFELFNPKPVFYKGKQAVKSHERFRKDLLIATGHYELVVNIKGECRAEAKSISFAELDEVGFDIIYRKTIQYALAEVIEKEGFTYETIDNWVSQIIDFA
jgi:hypothetical protein